MQKKHEACNSYRFTAKISPEWTEPPYKGIAAGCCQNGCGGYLEKLTAYKAPEQGSTYLFMSNRLKIMCFTSDLYPRFKLIIARDQLNM